MSGEDAPNIKRWFNNEVYPRRLLTSIVTVCCIITPFSFFINFLLRVSLFHPFHWFTGFWSLFQLTTYFYTFVIILLSVVLVGCCSYTFNTSPKVFMRNLDVILHVLRPFNLILVITFGMMSGIGTWIYLDMNDSDLRTLVVACENEKSRCLNDRHVFIVFHGVFVGVMYAIDIIVNNYNCANFPIAQRKVFIQVKFGSATAVKQSISTVVRRSKVFLLLYAVWGTNLCERIIAILHLESSRSSSWTLMRNLFSFQLWWYAIVTGAAVYFMFHLVTVCHNIFQIQRIIFPIHSILDEECKRTLSSAISCNDCHLIKMMGFYDLKFLSSQSPDRRQDLFRISIPGSHPVYWSTVVTASLDIMNELIKSLKSRFDQFDENVNFKSDASELPPKFLVQSNVPFVSQPASLMQDLSNKVRKKFAEGWKAFETKSVMAYFFREIPLASVNKIFASCQIHIWAVESLSYLIISSVSEDKYGVVQWKLTQILETMIELQKAINRVLKNEMGPTRRPKIIPSAISLQMTLKMAIYRIVIKFEEHIKSLGLSPEHVHYLQRYKEYEDY